MNHQSLLEELNQKAVFLFLSRSEGFSNSLVEAMMMGLPIIATNVGANQDMIEEKGGILFNIEQLETNIDYCIKEIVAYISDSERLNKSSIFNIEKVKTCYTINKIMPLLLDLYFTTEGV